MQVLFPSFQKFTHFLAFPKRFYEKRPRIATTLAVSILLASSGAAYIIANQ